MWSCFSSLLWPVLFILHFSLKCHYDDFFFFIEAILKCKKVACMRRKILSTIFKYLFVPEIFKFLKYANWPNDDIVQYIQRSFDQIQ